MWTEVNWQFVSYDKKNKSAGPQYIQPEDGLF